MLAHRRTEGWLRRLVDEPLCVPDRVHRHLAGCRRCSADLERCRVDAAAAARLFSASAVGGGGSPGPAAAALARLRLRSEPQTRAPGARRARWLGRLDGPAGPRGRRRAGATVLAVAALAAAGTGAAAGWTRVFQPTTVAPLPVRVSDLTVLGRLATLGTLTGRSSPPVRSMADLAQAVAASGVALRLPRRLPAGVTGTPKALEVLPWSFTFTFQAARARRLAAGLGLALPPVPPGLDGATVAESAGPGVVAVYGGGGSLLPGVPSLALAAVRAPTIDTAGATLAELEAYLLRLPGLSSPLRQAVRALADPGATLPIPVPSGLLRSQVAQVSGHPAVLLTDGSGLVSAVVWEGGGLVRAVGGLLPPATVLALARAGD
ncbi:MAG TPA: hypothetical protein VNN74_01305 [Candidatus Micrarchaeia archaeon]|nr:hypothetical protein [Candidatus Micrarchaeia archaeon]